MEATPPPPPDTSAPPPSTATATATPASASSPNPQPPASTSSPAAGEPSSIAALEASSPKPIQPQALPPPRMRPPYTHLNSPIAVSPAASSPSAPPPASPASSAMPRGGMAIGVPAHHPRGPPTPDGYTGFMPPRPLAQQFGSLHRGPESTPQLRQPSPGIQNIGMIGSLSTPQIRPGTASGPQQPRPSHPPASAPSPSANQALSSQAPTHGLMQSPSMGSPSPALPQSPQAMHTPFRSQQRPQVLQPRPYHLPQSTPAASHQQSILSTQQQQQQKQQLQQHQHLPQQQQSSLQHQLHQNQQNLVVRNQQQLSQQQAARAPGPMAPQPDTPAALQAASLQPGDSALVTADADESGNRLLSKRSICELVAQVDPSEKLESEVEDVLIDIAEDFVESLTTFACSLAKHRKSSTLEAKDILLNAEKNWNITLPGFSGDEIKLFKKQHVNDIHRERLALIKKSMALSGDGSNTKNSAAQAAGNQKTQTSKPPPTGSP